MDSKLTFAAYVGNYLCRCYCKREVIFLDIFQICSASWGNYWLLCREGRMVWVDTLEPHSHFLKLCYFSYSSDHTLSQLTWLVLKHCYYIPTLFVIQIALCVETKSYSLGTQ
jgi:hypothetical protein